MTPLGLIILLASPVIMVWATIELIVHSSTSFLSGGIWGLIVGPLAILDFIIVDASEDEKEDEE